MSNNEWIGGKQIYPPQDNTSNEDDNWWDLDSEEFGIGVSGFKPKKDSFKVGRKIMTIFKWENESKKAQIAHDKFMSQALENKLNYEVKKDQELYQCHQYNKNGTPLSDIVYTMISQNKVHGLYYKNEICFDVDICEAVDTACIKLGLSSEDYSPYLLDKGLMIEIYLQ